FGDVHDRAAAPAALDQNGRAALAAVEAGGELYVADRHVTQFAGGVAKEHSDQVGSARRDRAVCPVHGDVAQGYVARAVDEHDGGNRLPGDDAGGIRGDVGRPDHGAVVSVDLQPLVDRHLLVILARADLNGVAGGGRVHGILNLRVLRIGARSAYHN